MQYKVLKVPPNKPSWARVGEVIRMEPNEAEAHVRGGFLVEHDPTQPVVKLPVTPQQKWRNRRK